MGEIPKWIPKKIIQEAEELGGADLDETEDLTERISADKGSHRERSRHNDEGQHNKHWKEVEHDTNRQESESSRDSQ